MRRPVGDLLGMLLRLAVVVGLALGTFLPGPPDVSVAAQPAAAPCDWWHEYDTTLAELGESAADWRVASLALGRGGQTLMDQRRAEVDPDVWCGDLPSVMTHEWMHLQQVRVYGSYQAAVVYYGGAEGMELAADCGARLLGATYTPYLDAVPDCPDGLRRNARFLVNYRPHDLAPAPLGR